MIIDIEYVNPGKLLIIGLIIFVVLVVIATVFIIKRKREDKK